MSSLSYNAVSYEADDPIERIQELKWALTTIPTVEEVVETHGNSDTDGHLALKLNSEMVEPSIEEEIQKHDAWMKPPEFTDSGGISVEVMLSDIPDQEFEDSGTNQVRTRGGSKIIAIPPDAAKKCNIEEGDYVEFFSRKGEMLLREARDS